MKILFVCRGNTCRSVMMEAIAKQMIGDKAEIKSAGTEATSGTSIAKKAKAALSLRSIDFTQHRSQELSDELIDWADVILTVTRQRAFQITDYFPQASSKVRQLDPNIPIEDPIGASVSHYTEVADNIEAALKKRFTELGLL